MPVSPLLDPKVAWDGESWLVLGNPDCDAAPRAMSGIWGGTFDGAHAQRFTTDLQPIDLVPFNLPEIELVATNGNDFLVVWHWNNGTKGFISAAGVSHGGTVLDPTGFVIADYVPYLSEINVAWDGSNYWVAWPHPADSFALARVTPAGVVLDPDGFLVSHGQDDAGFSNIRGRLMLADGSFLGSEFTISAAPDRQLYPTVTWNGSEFVVAWQDKRNAEIYFDERTDIFGARITPDGVNLDPAGVPLAATSVPEIDPALVSFGERILLASSIFRPESPSCAYRIGIQVGGGATVTGDVDGDGDVDFADLLALLAAWGACAGCPADLNGDGAVGFADLIILLANWG